MSIPINKKTTEDFKKEVLEKVGNEYEVISEYTGCHNYITMKHNICGKIYNVTPRNFLKGRKCPHCYKKNKPLYKEEFFKRIKDTYGEEYSCIDEKLREPKSQVIHKELYKFRHNTCGNEYYVTANAFLSKRAGCANCKGKTISKAKTFSNEKFLSEVLERSPEFKPLEEYKGNETAILFRHKKCGRSFYAIPYNLFLRNKCPHCCPPPKKRTQEEASKEIKYKLGKHYHLVSKYIDSHHKVDIYHVKCGKTYSVVFREILKNGGKCPFCSVKSKGEERITKFLNDSNFGFTTQYKDLRCKRKQFLPFDFFVKELNLLIEYDGEFHYKNILGEKYLRDQQERDKFKTEFAEKYGFNLLRVPYWEFDNIENILENKIKELQAKK